MDKVRPAVVLTRELLLPHLSKVTVAPITSRVKELPTEVTLDQRNGLDRDCVVSCDNITTVGKVDLGRLVGYLLPEQERELTVAIGHAFDLRSLT